MRLIILAICGVVAGAVFVLMFLSIWSSRGTSERSQQFHHSAVSEAVWVAIPWVMIVAAAIPAVIAIMTSRSGH